MGASWGVLQLWPPMVCGSCTWNLPAGGSISEQEGDSNKTDRRENYRALTACQTLSYTLYTEHFIEPSQQLYEVSAIIILILYMRKI